MSEVEAAGVDGAIDVAEFKDLTGDPISLEFDGKTILFRSMSMLNKLDVKSAYGRDRMGLEIKVSEKEWRAEAVPGSFDVWADGAVVLRAVSRETATEVLDTVHGQYRRHSLSKSKKEVLQETVSSVLMFIGCVIMIGLVGGGLLKFGWQVGGYLATRWGF